MRLSSGVAVLTVISAGVAIYFVLANRHADPPPEIELYTRQLTLVWTVFFVAMAAVSGGLAAIGAG